MNILVTGGAGYIGSHVVAELLEKKHKIIVFDNLSTGSKKGIIRGAKFIKGSLLDKKAVARVFSENKVDAVMHLAGSIEVEESTRKPQKYIENNIFSGINLLEEMRKNNVQSIVFSSTAAVYGEPQKLPITEDHPKNPTNMYGRTKLVFEQVLEGYKENFSINYIVLRYFNACGAHPKYKIGENHKPETHLIPNILQSILNKKTHFTLFGTDYNTKDGTAVRDFIHVCDIATAHLLALEVLGKRKAGEAYNVGSEKQYTVKEILSFVKKITGENVKTKKMPKRTGDPAILLASTNKIRTKLGYRPKYGIKEIIQTAWEWEKKKNETKNKKGNN